MEITDFMAVIFNPVAQAKFVHTVSAGYVTGAMFVMSISAFYLLRGRNVDFAKRSMAVAASFGLAAALSVVVLGDESGYAVGENQKMKLAAIEAMWETEPAPAGFNAFAIPDQETRTNHYAVHIPYVMGIIGTRSLNKEMPGILELVERAEGRIRNGIVAYENLQKLRANRGDSHARYMFETHWRDIGHALLLKKYREDIANATDEEIVKAAFDTVPHVAPLFWSFRLMVGLGFYFIAFFAFAFWLASKHQLDKRRWFLRLAFYSLPLPWIAIEAGWLIAEYGRQPWVIDGVLPTFFAASGLKLHQILITLSGFVTIYTVLAVVEIWLMRKLILKGPEELSPEPHGATAPATPPVTAI